MMTAQISMQPTAPGVKSSPLEASAGVPMEDDHRQALFVQQQRPQTQEDEDGPTSTNNGAPGDGGGGQQPHLERTASNNSSNDLMMTEYDEDNVIVIDLTEERNTSAKFTQENGNGGHQIPLEAAALGPRALFGGRDGVFDFDENDRERENGDGEAEGGVVGALHVDRPSTSDILADSEDIILLHRASGVTSSENESEVLPEARKNLTTPPLQKTSTVSASHFEAVEASSSLRDEPEVIRGSTGPLPPVVVNKTRYNMMRSATLNNGSNAAFVDEVGTEAVEAANGGTPKGPASSGIRKPTSPSKRASAVKPKRLQRSKTINVPDVPENYNACDEFANNINNYNGSYNNNNTNSSFTDHHHHSIQFQEHKVSAGLKCVL